MRNMKTRIKALLTLALTLCMVFMLSAAASASVPTGYYIKDSGAANEYTYYSLDYSLKNLETFLPYFDSLIVDHPENVIWVDEDEKFVSIANWAQGTSEIVDVVTNLGNSVFSIPGTWKTLEPKMSAKVDYVTESADKNGFDIILSRAVALAPAHVLLKDSDNNIFNPIGVSNVSGNMHFRVSANLIPGQTYSLSLVKAGWDFVVTFDEFTLSAESVPVQDPPVSEITTGGFKLNLSSAMPGLTAANFALADKNGHSASITGCSTPDAGLTYVFTTAAMAGDMTYFLTCPGDRYELSSEVSFTTPPIPINLDVYAITLRGFDVNLAPGVDRIPSTNFVLKNNNDTRVLTSIVGRDGSPTSVYKMGAFPSLVGGSDYSLTTSFQGYDFGAPKIITPNKITVSMAVSSASTSGFDLTLGSAVSGLTAQNFILKDSHNNDATFSVKTDDNKNFHFTTEIQAGASYTIAAINNGYDFGAAQDVIAPINIINAGAVNGSVFVFFDGEPNPLPTIGDFVISRTVGDVTAPVIPTAVTWDAATRKLVLTVDQVPATGTEIPVTGTISYLATPFNYSFTVYPSVAYVAQKITTIDNPAQDATVLALPAVSAGFSIAIKSAAPAGVISNNGTIFPPVLDTTVSLVLTVTQTSTGQTANTAALNVVVPGSPITVARSFTTITVAPGAVSLTLPAIPNEYTRVIKSSSNTDVIALNGTVVPPFKSTTVDLVYEITKTTNGSKADTAAISVVVPQSPAAAAVNAANNSNTMPTALIDPALGLNLAAYNLLSANDKTIAANSVISFRPPLGFNSKADVQAALDRAVTYVNDRNDAMAVKNALTPGYAAGDSAASVTKNLTPITSSNGVSITWSTDGFPVTDSSGAVHRPAYTAGNKTVTFQALIVKGEYRDTKTFTLTVIKLDQTETEALGQVNTAANTAEMQTALTNSSLGLDLAKEFNGLSANDKTTAVTAVLSSRPIGGFISKAALQTVLDTAITSIQGWKDITAAKQALTIGYTPGDSAASVNGNLTLTTTGTNGTTITWASNNPTVIAANGTVTRPSFTAGNAIVTLTATIEKGGVQDTKQFIVTVIKLPQTVTEALTLVNTAANVKEMQTALTNTTLGLNLTAYNNLANAEKTASAQTLITNKPVGGYSTAADVQTALNNAIGAKDQNSVAVAKRLLTIGYSAGDSAASVASRLTLATAGADNVSISWVSDTPTVVTNAGLVTRPSYIDGNKTVNLTATLTKNAASDTKIFTITVIKIPQTPTGLSAASENAQVTLNWTAADGATSYKVYKSTTSGSNYSEVDAATKKTATTYKVTGLTNGTQYYFVVKASNAGADSANSNEATATPQSSDASLSTLTLSGVTLTPGFTTGTKSYTASVANNVDKTTVAATAAVAGATVTPADLGEKTLTVGANTITVHVTAANGTTTDTYTVTITRAAPVLGSLTLTAADVTGAENDGKTKITVTETPGAGNELVYKNFLTGTVTLPDIDEVIDTGWTVLPGDGIIAAANGDKIVVAERVMADKKAKKAGQTTAIVVAVGQSTAPLAANIAVTNNAGATDTVVVTGLAAEDVVKVYNSSSGTDTFGTATVGAGASSATISNFDLGLSTGYIYVTVTSKDLTEGYMTESTRTEKVSPGAPQTTAPLAASITVTNAAGAADTVAVTGLAAGDIVNVYKLSTGAEKYGTATVAAGAISAAISALDLGTSPGHLFVSVTSPGKTESTRTDGFIPGAPVLGSLTVSAADVTGAENDGKTKITVIETAGTNNELVYKNFTTGTVTLPGVDEVIDAGWTVLADGIIPAAHGDKIVVAERVIADKKAKKAGQTTAVVAVEPVPSTAPLATNITVTNSVGAADSILISGLTAGDIVKVYTAATDGTVLGTVTAAAGGNTAAVSNLNLGAAAGNVYVSVTSTGKTESNRTAKAFNAEPVLGSLTLTTADVKGPLTDGRTKITVTEEVGTDNELVYKNYQTGSTNLPGIYEVIDDAWRLLPSDGIITAINGDKIVVAERVKANKKALKAGQTTAIVVAESSNASLIDLTLSGISLTPSFAPGTKTYTASVASTVAATTVTAAAADTGAVITAADLGVKTLAEGANTIKINVTAANGISTDVYTVTVTKATAKAEAITAAINAITALPATITLADKTNVAAARGLVDAAKAKGAVNADITNLAKLVSAEAKIAELEAALPENVVKAQIAALPAKADVTLANQAAVAAARTAYDALTTEQKSAVGSITKLTDAEDKIIQLEVAAATVALVDATIKGTNADLNNVTADLTLVTSLTAVPGVTINWGCSNPAVNAATGAVTRPAYDAEDVVVVLTATLHKGASTDTKSFTVKVKKHQTAPPTNLQTQGDTTYDGVDGRDFIISWTPSISANVTSQQIYILPTGTPLNLSAHSPVATINNNTTSSWTGEQSLNKDSAGADLARGRYRIFVAAVSADGKTPAKADTTAGFPVTPAGIMARDNDFVGPGVDGRDFTVTWTPSITQIVTKQHIYILPVDTVVNRLSEFTPAATFNDNTTNTWTGTSSLTLDGTDGTLAAKQYRIYVMAELNVNEMTLGSASNVNMTAVNDAPLSAITAFGVPGEVEGTTIDPVAHTVQITVPNSTDFSSIVATFTLSTGATAKVGTTVQVSGTTPNDFRGPVIYTITGTDSRTQEWTVTVAPSNAKNIHSFWFTNTSSSSRWDDATHKVDCFVPPSTDVTDLVAHFDLSHLATAYIGTELQVSDSTSNDFTTPKIYTMKAYDGSTQDWTVTVRIDNGKNIFSFGFWDSDVQVRPEIIDFLAHTVDVRVKSDTTLTNLVANFNLSYGASATVGSILQESGTTPNDFTSPVTYTVAGANGTQNWTVTVHVEGDQESLAAAITAATELLDSKVIGSAVGNVPQAAHDAFSTVITAAIELIDSGSPTQDEIDAALTELAAATKTFNDAVIAETDVFDDIASEMAQIYAYLDEGDKSKIDDVRTALNDLTDSQLDGVITPLLKEKAVAKFSSVDEAKTQLRTFIRGLGEIYYSTDQSNLADTLRNFKTNNSALFTKLFGGDITVSELYNLLIDTKAELPSVIKDSEDPISLFTKSDAELKALWPDYAKTAIRKVIATPDYTDFGGKLGAIEWSAEMLIDRQQALADLADTNHDIELMLGKAYIRSQTVKATGDTELTADGSTTYTITIMGVGASSAAAKVKWFSSNTDVASFDSTLYKNKLSAHSTGTTEIRAYRDSEGATPENDWILKFTVTVTAP